MSAVSYTHLDGRIQIPYGENVRIESLISDGTSSDLVVATTKFKEDAHDKTRWVARDSIALDIPRDEWRREAKRQLYVILSRETGISFPWGALTGVRPTQIACQEIERATWNNQGLQSEWYGKVFDRMTHYWKLSEQKTKLVIETALAEQRILASLAYPKTNGAVDDGCDNLIIQGTGVVYPCLLYTSLGGRCRHGS